MQHHILHWEFDPAPLSSGYSGPETYQESRQTLSTSDGRVSLGGWRYDGRLQSSHTMQNHQIWVVVAGTARVEIDGETIPLTTGSAICFEAPYGPKVVEASDGFQAVWVSVPKAPG